MIDLRLAIFVTLVFSPFCAPAQASMTGLWGNTDGSSEYEVRSFEYGKLEARVLNTTRTSEKVGRIVLDHIMAGTDSMTFSAVIHSAERDVPREVEIHVKDGGRKMDIKIPRIFSGVHVIWERVPDNGPSGTGSMLSLNE